jgi:CheY-like chemotaxis protein
MPDFDVLLLDLHMPELDGFQVVEAIREREQSTKAHLPVIALTARSRREDREHCLAAAGSPKCPSLVAGTTECHPELAGESLALPVGLRSIDCDPCTQPLVPWDDETDRCTGL